MPQQTEDTKEAKCDVDVQLRSATDKQLALEEDVEAPSFRRQAHHRPVGAFSIRASGAAEDATSELSTTSFGSSCSTSENRSRGQESEVVCVSAQAVETPDELVIAKPLSARLTFDCSSCWKTPQCQRLLMLWGGVLLLCIVFATVLLVLLYRDDDDVAQDSVWEFEQPCPPLPIVLNGPCSSGDSQDTEGLP